MMHRGDMVVYGAPVFTVSGAMRSSSRARVMR